MIAMLFQHRYNVSQTFIGNFPENMSESGQNCPDAANIEMSQAWFWHITVCLQGYKNTSRLFREHQNGSAYYWIY